MHSRNALSKSFHVIQNYLLDAIISQTELESAFCVGSYTSINEARSNCANFSTDCTKYLIKYYNVVTNCKRGCFRNSEP